MNWGIPKDIKAVSKNLNNLGRMHKEEKKKFSKLNNNIHWILIESICYLTLLWKDYF